jgi:hypothetical protein
VHTVYNVVSAWEHWSPRSNFKVGSNWVSLWNAPKR